MLFYDHVYTSDRAELWIVSQTLRGSALFSRGNTVTSEDRKMIDGIVDRTPFPHMTGCALGVERRGQCFPSKAKGPGELRLE
ncbi:hypothetical protein EAG_06522 [Camponotus floridanus]|uniref:Uncharacterized protein n=1 Tax=Camponotus floridanus TaxID=104421 RepID=E1ZX36_CAMFO|nr:hypothetical protein EAG_06522 [Camponotus floridanus]